MEKATIMIIKPKKGVQQATVIFCVALLAVTFAGCRTKPDGEIHDHGAEGPEPLAYTLYTDKTELFVEFKPLVVGSQTRFAAHFTLLGEQFLPLTNGTVSVSLVMGENGIRNSADKYRSTHFRHKNTGIHRSGNHTKC
jgi:membrane fusion protein, heavy metal efflux system